MLVERSEITIREGQAEGFIAAMNERGLPMLASFPGVESVRFGRGVENPDKFILLVEWTKMEAHVAFSQSEVIGPFRELFAPFSTGGVMEHFEID
ncbi:antibiotic biosynthesis monooxygenase [Phenylobacterium sp. LjRoot219]|uniref:antibiotic biosynthesis monooxygenase family protein n=1 Tax=Phenylobacterium sp. LjRoot219 TaxID=3342283 RepID=UPI003ECEBC67